MNLNMIQIMFTLIALFQVMLSIVLGIEARKAIQRRQAINKVTTRMSQCLQIGQYDRTEIMRWLQELHRI